MDIVVQKNTFFCTVWVLTGIEGLEVALIN